MSKINNFLNKVRSSPETISFAETIAIIDEHYQFQPTSFINGALVNEAGQNNGSCKIFSFARLHELSTAETLALFGDYYRVDVLKHPQATDHQNIRNFMETGWDGVQFSRAALSPNC